MSYIFLILHLMYIYTVLTSECLSPFSSGIGFVQTQLSVSPSTLYDWQLFRYERVHTIRNTITTTKAAANKLVVSENTS